jgi:hypothetical protein
MLKRHLSVQATPERKDLRRNLRLMKRLSFIDVANASCDVKMPSFWAGMAVKILGGVYA